VQVFQCRKTLNWILARSSHSVHLVEAAVDFKVVIRATVTSIFVRLELRATAIPTQVVRIGLLYAALRGPRVLLKAVTFCGLTRALRSSVVTCRVAYKYRRRSASCQGLK
jgi:hypothetical protein